MTKNYIINIFRMCKLKQVSENKWQLGIFNFTIVDDEYVVFSGKIPYALLKQICSEKYYPSELFVLNESSSFPIAYFLTNEKIERCLRNFCSNSSFDYETYSKLYDKKRLELINLALSNHEYLFFEKDLKITSISALMHTIQSIKQFCSE